MPDITVRHATVDDVDALAPLFDGYRQFYGQPSDIAKATAFLRARLTNGESKILIADHGDDGRAVGFVQVYPSFSSVRCAPIWILNDVFVASDARRLGVGDALMAATEAAARRAGVAYVTLTTAHTNRDAQRLYERSGYELDQEFRTYTRMTAP
jgi:ribosomal protein S18 acetylase RimI-like enzyme